MKKTIFTTMILASTFAFAGTSNDSTILSCRLPVVMPDNALNVKIAQNDAGKLEFQIEQVTIAGPRTTTQEITDVRRNGRIIGSGTTYISKMHMLIINYTTSPNPDGTRNAKFYLNKTKKNSVIQLICEQP